MFIASAKKAGDKITCVTCGGKGYVLGGLVREYPVECKGCRGTGIQTVRKSW